jgi:hypothetical protein
MAVACAGHPLGSLGGYARPPQLVGEWVDLHKTTESDTSIWVLRPDGYDGILHVRVVQSPDGTHHVESNQTRHGSWYLDGTMSDSTHRALCFSRRLGRFGATCISFSADVDSGSARPRRLRLFGYRGEHSTGTRELVPR